MKRTTGKRVFSFLLAMLIIHYSFYPSVSKAATGDAVDNSGTMDSPLSEPYVEEKSEEQLRSELDTLTYEVESLREENIKHFHLPDGTYQAVIYGSAVHRLNSDGEWVDIDNSLTDEGENYATSDARFKFVKKITGNENLFTIHDGEYKITVGLEDAIKKTEGTFTNTNGNENESRHELPVDLDHISSSVVYKDILEGIDLEYILISNNIKENIIVKEKSDQYSYTFTLKLSGLTAELENNSVYLYDDGTGEIRYQIPQPYMYDAEGEMSTDVIYSLTELDNGKYTLSVDADNDWINDEKRVFPVTIDPILLDNGQTEDTYVYSSAPSTNYGSSQYLWVLNSAEAYYKFTTPTLPNGATVTNALLEIPFYYNVENGKYLTMGAYQITSNWSEDSATWNTKPSTGTSSLGNSNLYANGASASAPEYGVFNVTSYVKGWYSGTPNYGFAMKRVGGENTSVLLVAKEMNLADAQLYVYYSGSDLADGVFAIQKKGTQTYLKTTRSTYSGTVTQETTHTTTPNSASDRDNLFKVSYRPQYDDYVIRSMIDNALVLYANVSSSTVSISTTRVADASLITYYTWNIEPSGGYYYITHSSGGTTYYLRSASTANGASLSLTTNAGDSGTLWFFNKYSGNVLEGVVGVSVKTTIVSGNSYSAQAYMYSTRINHNGPVSYTVKNADDTTTDKATVSSSAGWFKALKPGRIKLIVTYPGAPYIWYWYVTIEPAGCKPYNAITSSTDSEYAAMNCHGYAFWSTESLSADQWFDATGTQLSNCGDSNDFLALVKTNLEKNWLDEYIGDDNWEDVTDKGGINAELADNQWLIVMRAGYHEDCLFQPYDYHFWYRTDTGEWVNKHGYSSYSETLGSDLPTTSGSDGWKLSGAIYLNGTWYSVEYEDYYDSDLVYYRITEE